MTQITEAVSLLLIVMTMGGMGCELSLDDLRLSLKNPKAAIVGILCQTVVNPLFFLAVISAFGLTDAEKVAAMAIATSPGGSGSNFMTLITGGDVALSIALTCCSCVVCFVTMPLLFRLYTQDVLGISSSASVPFLSLLGGICAFARTARHTRAWVCAHGCVRVRESAHMC